MAISEIGFGELEHTPPEYSSVKDAIAAGMRIPLKIYVFTMKMEAEGYSTRACRHFKGWHIEVIVPTQNILCGPDVGTNGFHLSTYDHAEGSYILCRYIE